MDQMDHYSQMLPAPWLSVILPVFNVDAYLAECLNSILSQIVQDPGIEILIVDDASTDNSRAIANGFRTQYPGHIRIICHETNLGVSATRNRLVDAACGAYIWFIDPDDYMEPGAINALRKIVTLHKPELVLCDYRKNKLFKTASFGGPKGRISSDIEQLVTGVFKSRKLYCWIKISRRDLWKDDIRFPVGRVFEDVATIPQLLLNVKTYYYAPAAWVFYRQRSGSIMDSVKRRCTTFDIEKHRDLSRALQGFKDAYFGLFPINIRGSACYAMSDFCAKEFTKTAYRILRSRTADTDRAATVALIASFVAEFETSSPMRFRELCAEYVKKGRFIRFAILLYYLRVAKV